MKVAFVPSFPKALPCSGSASVALHRNQDQRGLWLSATCHGDRNGSNVCRWRAGQEEEEGRLQDHAADTRWGNQSSTVYACICNSASAYVTVVYTNLRSMRKLRNRHGCLLFHFFPYISGAWFFYIIWNKTLMQSISISKLFFIFTHQEFPLFDYRNSC